MSEERDALDDLLNFNRRSRDKRSSVSAEPAGADGGEASERGLNPLDLLELPRDQRQVINWLSRKRQATLEEIQEALDRDNEALQSVLRGLTEADYLHEALIDGEVYYRVVYRGRLKRMARGLPNHIWARIDMDRAVFLQQMPLFKDLPEDLLQAIAAELIAHRFKRNEVIAAQGDQSLNLYLIRNGIVGMTRQSLRTQSVNILAYLYQSEIFGEYSLFAETPHTAPATATALSEVNVFTIKHETLSSLLRANQNTTIEVTRILSQRLNEMRDRATASHRDSNTALVIDIGTATGVERILGTGLATAASRLAERGAVYTEHPNHFLLPRAFGFERREKLSRQPGGFDVFVPRSMPTLSAKARVTMVLEQLAADYDSVIVGMPGRIEDANNVFLERASQIILVAAVADWEELARFHKLLTKMVHLPGKEMLRVVVVAADDTPPPAGADIAIVQPDDASAQWRGGWEALPEQVRAFTSQLADRLRRQNEISIYLPQSLTGADNQLIDTTAPIAATVALMRDLFGDVQQEKVKESWAGDHGLRAETVNVIRSRVTETAMKTHLQTIVHFAEQMKGELQQEVLAIDINHSLVLV